MYKKKVQCVFNKEVDGSSSFFGILVFFLTNKFQ